MTFDCLPHSTHAPLFLLDSLAMHARRARCVAHPEQKVIDGESLRTRKSRAAPRPRSGQGHLARRHDIELNIKIKPSYLYLRLNID